MPVDSTDLMLTASLFPNLRHKHALPVLTGQIMVPINEDISDTSRKYVAT
jgi:hypothetical protein